MIIKIDIPKPEAVQIELWDKVYELQMSEATMVDRFIGLYTRAEAFTKADADITAVDKIKALLADCQSFIDDMLGEGAAYELFGKRPVGLVQMVNIIKLIVKNATQGYSKKLDSYD